MSDGFLAIPAGRALGLCPEPEDGLGQSASIAIAPRIITTLVYPPIPLRQFDWTAHRDGEEESGPTGFGATEGEAVADLMQLIEDMQP